MDELKRLREAMEGTDRLKSAMDAATRPLRLLEEMERPTRLQETMEMFKRLPPPRNALLEIAEGGTASAVCQHIAREIRSFQAELDPELDVALRLITFGQAMTIHVESINYQDPSLIYFYGSDLENGTPVQLIQHVQQLSFLLTTFKRENPDEDRAEFGFPTPQTEPEGEQ